MDHRSILFLILILVYSESLLAQKTKTSEGSCTIRIEKNWTEEEATQKALTKARVNAIENAFGSTIIEGNTISVKNNLSGENASSEVNFNSIANIETKGEWIKDETEPTIKIERIDDYSWITVHVRGKVRELKKIPVSFSANTLTCPEEKCSTTSFTDGQSLFVSFKAPKDGFLSIYMDDNNGTTFRLLPYRNSKKELSVNYPVVADKQYFFFSEDHDYYDDRSASKELIVYSNTSRELNKIYILYSPDKHEKPLISAASEINLDQKSTGSDFLLPDSLSTEDFEKWLQKTKTHLEAFEIQPILIDINKN